MGWYDYWYYWYLYWRLRKKRPPSAIRDLKATLTKGANMTIATLTWTPPTTRTDGTVLAANQIAGADIFDSATPGPAVPIGSVVGDAGMFVTNALSVGTHIFTVVTRDTNGVSSANSNMASAAVIAAAPSAISDLKVVLS